MTKSVTYLVAEGKTSALIIQNSTLLIQLCLSEHEHSTESSIKALGWTIFDAGDQNPFKSIKIPSKTNGRYCRFMQMRCKRDNNHCIDLIASLG